MTNALRLLSAAALLGCAANASAETVRFNRDIRPILSENCFQCHGPDSNARQADLRLDRREVAVSRGALQPGDAAASKLVARINASNEVLVMPPPATDKKLSSEQKNLLKQWIEQGAEYESHWAYIPPRRSEAPDGSAAIDHLLAKGLHEKGIEPAVEAEPVVLARRLNFDLTGLPPSYEAVSRFVTDSDPGAYEKLLEELLASRHFGERMAVHWLDLVRYADTVGYHGDVPMNVYPFRDWVVESFNENKPFDEFTREQLAGDLLPDATPEQLVGSGYNRLSRMTNEGGSQPKEYLAKYAADRVRNISTVWLSSTMGCSECHDHKFDPFLAKDFYSMAAFFADIEEKGVADGNFDWGSHIRVLPDRAASEMADIDKKLETLHESGDGKLSPTPKNVNTVARYLQDDFYRWRLLDPERVRQDCEHPDFSQCDLYDLTEEDNGLVRVSLTGEKKPRKVMHQLEIGLGEETISALAIELFPTADFHQFELSEFQVRLLGRADWPMRVSIEALVPDHEGPKSMLRHAIDENFHSGWRGSWVEEPRKTARRALFVFEQPIHATRGEKLQVTALFYGRRGENVAGLMRLLATDADFPELPASGELRAALLAKGRRSDAQQEAVVEAFEKLTGGNTHWPEIRRLERRKKTLLDHAGESLIAKSVEPRKMRILPRGNWMDDSGQVVEPQAPHFLNPPETNGRQLTRLDLANWVVDRDNPLTARVFVNRLWKMFFGTGLSKVLDDIGSQGESPRNQELLDWLAVEFMESGWDVKHIVKTMLMSKAYRRSSEPSEELLAADPGNRLHGRQTMARLDAEFVRDNLLAVSGLLNRTMGGPSVKPYQPAGYYEELNFPKRIYEADLNPNQFRRGVYTHWQRQYVHPSLMAFDAPSREECAAERAVSNTPLQSLVLLNDPSYIEAARAFAGRVLKSAKSDRARVEWAFQEAFSRRVQDEEAEVVLALLESRRGQFKKDPAGAEQLLKTGITHQAGGAKKTELAAWTSVARALFNKHEFVMRY